MPWYELFCLARPQLARAQQAELLRTAARTVFAGGGVVADLKSFGDQRLAYAIREAGNKWSEGFAWQATFVASPKVLPELAHSLKVDDRVLRHLIFRRQPHGPQPSTHAVRKRALRKMEAAPAPMEAAAADAPAPS